MSSNSNYSSWRMAPQTSISYSQLPPIRPATNFANYRENNDSRYCNQCFEPSRRQPRNQNRRTKKNGSRKNKNRDYAYWLRVFESPVLRDEDRLLVKLKGIDNLSWKTIQAKFNSTKCKKMRQPALQMRMTRLGDKMDVRSYSSSPNLIHHKPLDRKLTLELRVYGPKKKNLLSEKDSAQIRIAGYQTQHVHEMISSYHKPSKFYLAPPYQC